MLLKSNNMNGRRLFREYAQSKGYEAKEFVEIKDGWYDESDTLITKDNNGNEEKTSIDYKSMIHWIIKTKKE
tara:strand:+ start:2016 stop:2231 length:216 start_codon:yes stop_codon:yes gene_type:complete